MCRWTMTLLLCLLLFVPLAAQPAVPQDAAECALALRKLTVVGSVLYIAAHPDDENTAFLATMAKGRLLRTAYLSCTRGEGGQNLIGSELGEMLGLIRTEELLAARRIDGAEQYFTRAIDFGFSKTSDETFRFWGRERTLGDVVWVIRRFRPDLIVTRFTPTLGGHGNHTASAALAEEAFRAAADPERFPEQFPAVKPWQAKRIVWNVFRFSANDSVKAAPGTIMIDLGAYAPLLGRSFLEIAGEGRSMHKSQGFGSAQNRGEFLNAFQHVAGDTAHDDLFAGVNMTWSRIPGGETVGRLLEEAVRSFRFDDPSASVPVLLRAWSALAALPEDPWVDVKRNDLRHAIAACAGLWVEASTSEASGNPGGTVKCEANIINRSRYPFRVERILFSSGTDTVLRQPLTANHPLRASMVLRIPLNARVSQPYWLEQRPGVGAYMVSESRLVGTAQNDPAVQASIEFSSPEGAFTLDVPLLQKFVDPVEGEQVRPFLIVPPVTVTLEESVFLFTGPEERPVHVRVRAGRAHAQGEIKLFLPNGWRCEPEKQAFRLEAKGDEAIATFRISPVNGSPSGSFHAEATIDGMIVNRGLQTAQYKHIPPLTWFPVAEGKLLRIDLQRTGQHVGYIMGAGDEMPGAIRQMGFDVALLSDADLAEADLSRYDVIVSGIRAYNTRAALRAHQDRLMEYVKGGGTYVVQYVTAQRTESEHLGPYPFTVSRDRVTEEDAHVTLLRPGHPILAAPNPITPKDFDGWVQERGLYFADKWDVRYDSLLACHDTNEPERSGGLLAATYGSGTYVFCAYAFFRQLPAGVEGAYRLFANVLSWRGKKR
jgi:LmbE family N-acetylglucosaminyl deacetylase